MLRVHQANARPLPAVLWPHREGSGKSQQHIVMCLAVAGEERPGTGVLAPVNLREVLRLVTALLLLELLAALIVSVLPGDAHLDVERLVVW